MLDCSDEIILLTQEMHMPIGDPTGNRTLIPSFRFELGIQRKATKNKS